jgi:hypothetical protein
MLLILYIVQAICNQTLPPGTPTQLEQILLVFCIYRVVSKSGNPGTGPLPNSYFLYYIFIKALILIKFEHNV